MKGHKKISILVSGPLPPPVGGMTVYCQDYLRSSLPEDFDITFCRSILIIGGFTRRGLVGLALKVLNTILITIVWISMLFIKRPHIVHVHTSSYTGFYVKSLLTLLARITCAKTVLHVHGGKFREFYENSCWFLRWIIRRLLSANSCVIVLSGQLYNFFESEVLIKTRIAVMPNSVFLPTVSQPRESRQLLTVLFMSRFTREKGIYDLFKVIEQREDLRGKCRFILAGPKTHEWANVARRLVESNLSESVEMPGVVVGEEKEHVYMRADIYVLQSHVENMPIGLLEAMSYGLACITTSVGGIPEVVTDGQNGLLIEAGNSDVLAEALDRLIREPDLRLRLGHEARATIEREYDWAQRADQIKELYWDMLGIQQDKTPSSEENT